MTVVIMHLPKFHHIPKSLAVVGLKKIMKIPRLEISIPPFLPIFSKNPNKLVKVNYESAK